MNSGLDTRKNLTEKLPKFGHVPSEIFVSPILGRKTFKDISLKGRQIISLPVSPTCAGVALAVYTRYNTTRPSNKIWCGCICIHTTEPTTTMYFY